LLDDGSDRESFPGAGRAQQDLVPVSVLHAMYELIDSFRLVAGRLEGSV